jgi:crotonobetainyl-CoA:carnitine CoA-transferase CaiB-like acyl-CoA transferase
VRPGVSERLGIDYESLRGVNPDIVRCTITGWGEGPLSPSRCFDPLLQARGGMMKAQGGHDDPVLLSLPVNDVGSGTVAAFGALAALRARPAIGRGQEVTISLTLASLAFQAAEVTTFAGRPRPQEGGRDFPGPSALRRLYRCRDGWIALNASSGGIESLGPILGRRLAPMGGEAIEAALAELPAADALDRLATADIPAVRVLGRDAVFADPWLAANDFFVDVDDTEVGCVRAVRGFADWLGVPSHRTLTSRALGEDTTRVLREAGITDPAQPGRT